MSRRIVGWAGVTLLGAAAIAAPGSGQEPDRGKGEKAGEKIGRAVDKAADAVRERFTRARRAVEELGTEGRIYGRLHWDKSLHGSEIEVELREGGVAVLRGAVADAAAKAKAVTLAGETVGVERVVDELTVRTQAEGSGAPAPAARTGDIPATKRPPRG